MLSKKKITPNKFDDQTNAPKKHLKLELSNFQCRNREHLSIFEPQDKLVCFEVFNFSIEKFHESQNFLTLNGNGPIQSNSSIH